MVFMKRLLAAVVVAFSAAIAPAQFGGGPRTFEAVVQKVEATVEPATAKPGETVTWKLMVEIAPGWHTYPTVQPDANASSYVNKITPPKTGPLKFVGPVTEPANPIKKPLPGEDIKELRTYEGTVVWEQKAVVTADARSGETDVDVTVSILACDESGCLPPNKVPTTAKL